MQEMKKHAQPWLRPRRDHGECRHLCSKPELWWLVVSYVYFNTERKTQQEWSLTPD
jgi:hypothetical protein